MLVLLVIPLLYYHFTTVVVLTIHSLSTAVNLKTRVRIAERSVEGRHSVIHHIQKRAPRAGVPYLSLELRFGQLQQIAATNPECLQAMMTQLMGLETTAGLRKAIM